MTFTVSRGRLLAGAAFGLGLAMLAPEQAQAACTVAPGAPPPTSVTCAANTSTTDTTYVTGTTSSDRNFNVDTSASAFTGTVNSGVTVDTSGLAFTNTTGGTNAINVVNNGTVSKSAAVTQGGGSTLQVTAIGATPVNYSGEGNVLNTNLVSGHGLDFFMQGTGNLVANVGTAGGAATTISTVAPGSSAIQVNRLLGTAGTVNITTTSDTTLRGTLAGINIDASGTGTMTVNNAATIGSPTGAPNTLGTGIRVVEDIAGTGAISITNSGTIGLAGDRVQTSGITAAINNAASTAAINVQGTGAIFSAGLGLDVDNLGTGTTTVNYSGPINTTGATGVDVDATTGPTNVTLGGVLAATNAVDVTSTGPQTIALNGITTGTAGSGLVSSTSGARTVTVGSSGNVTGGTQAILLTGTGATTLGNSGTISAFTPGGVAINAAAAGATTVNNNSGGTINGRLTLSANADTFANQGTFNTQGITDFGAGTDVFTNSGTMNLTGATTLANVETINQSGLINLNTFVLTGPAIAFTNNGTIDTNGNAGLAGFTAFNNAVTLDLAAGIFTAPTGVFTNSGTILADEGAATITGQTSFANTGTIDLQDGAADDTLTIASAFAGSGGSNLDIDFTGSVSDLLVIQGAASGSTSVDANYLGGGFNLDGVLAVDTTSSSANAFVLGSVTGASPLVDVTLEQQGADYFLVAAPTAATFNPLVVPGFATDLWYQSADEIFAETVKPATTTGLSFWGEGYVSRDKYGDNDDTVTIDGVDFDVDNRLKTKRYGLQLGADYGFGGGRIGLSGGYGWADASGDADADLKAKGWNLGVYGQFGGLTGFHGEFLAKHDRYDAEFDDGAFDGVDFDIRATGIDGSLGYRFGMGGDATMDVHAGVSHVRTKVDDISAFGFDYDIAKLTSTRGRAGVRGTFGGNLAPYVDATVYHEFDGDGDVELFDGATAYDLDTRGKGTWVRLEAGLSGNDGPGPILAAWGDLGDRKGMGLRAGWRFGGHVAEAAPPPPPPVAVAPPPPPPPATQTCPDGSVILASDACPPPPPPPPPPPAPERG